VPCGPRAGHPAGKQT